MLSVACQLATSYDIITIKFPQRQGVPSVELLDCVNRVRRHLSRALVHLDLTTSLGVRRDLLRMREIIATPVDSMPQNGNASGGPYRVRLSFPESDEGKSCAAYAKRF